MVGWLCIHWGTRVVIRHTGPLLTSFKVTEIASAGLLLVAYLNKRRMDARAKQETALPSSDTDSPVSDVALMRNLEKRHT